MDSNSSIFWRVLPFACLPVGDNAIFGADVVVGEYLMRGSARLLFSWRLGTVTLTGQGILGTFVCPPPHPDSHCWAVGHSPPPHPLPGQLRSSIPVVQWKRSFSVHVILFDCKRDLPSCILIKCVANKCLFVCVAWTSELIVMILQFNPSWVTTFSLWHSEARLTFYCRYSQKAG